MRRQGEAISVLAEAPLLLLCSLILIVPGASGVWLNLPASGTKCVSEEIQPNVVVLADYGVIHEGQTDNLTTISVKVRSLLAFKTIDRLVLIGDQRGIYDLDLFGG